MSDERNSQTVVDETATPPEAGAEGNDAQDKGADAPNQGDDDLEALLSKFDSASNESDPRPNKAIRAAMIPSRLCRQRSMILSVSMCQPRTKRR